MDDGKDTNAYRTISEVAEALNVKAHVLRFWESKFDQIQPMKRGNGRRYYRPEDITFIAGIQHLLHRQGMTIKGVQKLIKDDGVDAVRAQAAGQPEKSGDGASLSLDQRSRLEAAQQNLQQAHILLEGDK
jgi:DNA-binding transcriptional MerR regulator